MFSDTFMDQFADAVAGRILDKLDGSSIGGQKLMDIQDAAKYLGRSPKAVQHMVDRGILPITRLDSKIQIDRAALDKLIRDKTYYEV